MGKLYEARCQIDQTIQDRNLNPVDIRGAIGLKAGFILALIRPGTLDDEEKYSKLRVAAQEVLGIQV